MKKKAGILIAAVAVTAALALTLTGCIIITIPSMSPASSGAATETPSTAPTLVPLTVTAQTIVVENDYVSINAEYPVISGMQDTAFQDNLNASVLADMNARVSQHESDAQAAHDADPAGGKFTLESQIGVHFNDGMLLSLSNRFYIYTGGAHPNPDSEFCTVLNTNSGRQLAILDLFTDSAEGKALVDTAINNTIAANPDMYNPGVSVSILSDEWFYITGTDLVVIFPAYEIASGAVGEPDFNIPLATLSDVLIDQIPH
ncbi:MAG: DUF3298 and DUF4163 domain-containing protein [Bacillota bacterium]|nr:DUF3298 and DUF4163 domain-containing protein [Bacillota bacterium]